MTDRPLFTTLTGECFQPVRLHYRVFDRAALLQSFTKLRCLKEVPQEQRWVWLYEDEARKLRFRRSYDQFPEKLRPIVIGSFFARQMDELLLDLRSCERAVAAIPFFDKHIPRSVAKVTAAAVVNRLFPADNTTITPDSLFDHQPSTIIDPEAIVQRQMQLVAHIHDPQENLRLITADVEARAKQPLPEIEQFPIYYYEEGIQPFETTLKVRQIIAMEHWRGNAAYSMFDVVQAMVR